jgi:hypothetical protein
MNKILPILGVVVAISALTIVGGIWDVAAPDAAGDIWVPLMLASFWLGLRAQPHLGESAIPVLGWTLLVFFVYKVIHLLLAI